MTASTINLRLAAPEDAPSLAALLEAMFAEWGLEAGTVAADVAAEVRSALTADGNSCEFLIAEVSGEDCGFAAYGEVFEPAFLRPGAFLRDLYVLPDWRRKGVGSALLRQLFEIASNRRWVSLDWHVNRLDFEARTFFEMVAPDGYTVDRLVHRLEGDALASLVPTGKSAGL